MIPVVQNIVGDGKEGRPAGDCFRACVASIFELPLEEVPHFVALGNGTWYSAFIEWLRPLGLTVRTRHLKRKKTPGYYPAGWWIATVDSEIYPESTHAVVMRGTDNPGEGELWEVAHDPSPRARTIPYTFINQMEFVAWDPAQVWSAHRLAEEAHQAMLERE